MVLRVLARKSSVSIDYYKNGLLQTCKGRVFNLDPYKQILYLKDDQQKTFSIRIDCIKIIH
jgi:hypothetical protein